MKNNISNLRNELSSVGAKDGELLPLMKLAARLENLHPSKIPTKTKQRQRGKPWGFKYAFISLTAATSLLIGMGLTSFSQSSAPGNILYPVKKLSERAAVLVRPEYRATVMMHRAEEVRQLVASHSTSKQVIATLADYNGQAASYKMPSYATLEYCKSNLRQAAHGANGEEKQAINKTLAALNS